MIRVANGTYLPDPNGLADPREATFQLANGVTIEGGYAGCGAADPDERDFTVYETTLSGDIGTQGNNADNSYHVVTGSGTDATAVLDGFTVTHGRANAAYPHNNGGGMYNWMDGARRWRIACSAGTRPPMVGVDAQFVEQPSYLDQLYLHR